MRDPLYLVLVVVLKRNDFNLKLTIERHFFFLGHFLRAAKNLGSYIGHRLDRFLGFDYRTPVSEQVKKIRD